MAKQKALSWWESVQRRFYHKPLGMLGLICIALFALVGVYAPFFASSKSIAVYYEGSWYFPLFRYLFYTSFYTKRIDLFFNLAMFTLPVAICFWVLRKKALRLAYFSLFFIFFLQIGLFLFFILFPVQDPAYDKNFATSRQEALKNLSLNGQGERIISWPFSLKYLNEYAKLNLVLEDYLHQKQHSKIAQEITSENWIPTLWQLSLDSEKQAESLGQTYLKQRRGWLEEQKQAIGFILMPLFRPFHWEDDAAGSQALNKQISFWDLTRINRKDFVAALCFGIRISLVVGFLAVALALMLAIPIGAVAGYRGGVTDIIICRFMEIWESMPTFFMLLFIIAIAQSKSIFLIVAVIGLFSWTSFARYLRGEMFKQRSLPYVEACHAQGFSHLRIIFSHLLPNAIPPLLTLLPFAVMGAITSEAGISFLGLGEEGSGSWGILMDEGRSAFPAESYLLWPPAILLTTLLIAIALVGDALRDAIDPKLS